MPRLNFSLILFALLVYALTASVTLRDRLLVSTLHHIERESFFEPSAKDLFEGAMSGMVDLLSDKLGDVNSRYISQSGQARYMDSANNQYVGFGFSFKTYDEEEGKKLIVLFPFPDSPAYRAGLRSGDQILEIDGTPIADKTRHEILDLLKQEKESETRLSIVPFGETESNVCSLRPEKIHYDSVSGDYFGSDGQAFYLETHPKVGYIRITSFTGTTAKEFGNALERMIQNGVESFILDLLDNPGGDVWNCVQVAQMLISPETDRKIIATLRDRSGQKRSFGLTEGTQRCTLPMVVLIDGESASSAEILAAALQDYHRATIIGTRSFGKGVIQGIITLPFQSGILQLTDAEYRRPNGANIHRKKDAADSEDWGVIPDRVIELSDAERSAVIEYRALRSNVVSTHRLTVLDCFRQKIIEGLEQENAELSGTAPYYDVQLEEAIGVLTNIEQ